MLVGLALACLCLCGGGGGGGGGGGVCLGGQEGRDAFRGAGRE